MTTASILNWETFEQLPGAATRNWEYLCRSAVVRNFAAVGSFRSVANQPGVEFHLKIERPSDRLGQPGRWWGWQCRWYDMPAGRQIGTTRRRAIEEAIGRTEQRIPDATDWVLWTRRPLTPTDQEWFYAIETSLDLHLWTGDDLEDLLQGDTTVLRRTYFGDLVFTKENLDELHEKAVAPVLERWNPAVHVEVDAEDQIRRILGEPDYWPEVGAIVVRLSASAAELVAFKGTVGVDLEHDLLSLVDDLEHLQVSCETLGEALAGRDMATIQQTFKAEWAPQVPRSTGRRLARTLRRRAHPSSLAVQAAIGLHQIAETYLDDLARHLACSLVAVVGQAGSGKTHLAAELTASRGDLPSGLFLEGWRLERRGTLEDLLVGLRGVTAGSFEELLEAVDAAGMRYGIRIPVVIDGLTEAEDPSTWKGELETLGVILRRFQHVLVVATLRPSAANIALPDDLARIGLSGFGRMTREAISRYFEHYKIDPGSLRFPLEQFRDPLFLRIFCEATNPGRQEWVGPNSIPTSLVAAFTKFRDAVVGRMTDRPGNNFKRYRPDILNALDRLALSMWEADSRSLPFETVREVVGDSAANWAESLARELVDEGVLSREPEGDQRTVILFDAFAGFLIADALTRAKGKPDFAEWARQEPTVSKLLYDLRVKPGEKPLLGLLRGTQMIKRVESWVRRVFRLTPARRERTSSVPPAVTQPAHPLALDIRKALVGLVPRRFQMQFWELVNDNFRDEVLVETVELEGELLEAETVNQIARLAMRHPPSGLGDLFGRFMETRDAPGHPLNAEFVDDLLGEMSVADRDLRWSEWVRRNEAEIISAILESTERWKSDAELTEADHLDAIWLKWLLTSTVRHLRDHATLALYQYGRRCPSELFLATLSSLGINDPYIHERMLAASYGVIMAGPAEGWQFDGALDALLDGLWSAFCGGNATNPTEHWLMLEYVDGIVQLSQRYYPAALGRWAQPRQYAIPFRGPPMLMDESGSFADDPVYGLDFKNYTVGGLVPGRYNYDFDHPGYQEVLSWIRGRVVNLAGNPERFEAVDRSIQSDRRGDYNRPDRVETYRKKYGWIGYFEAAGRLRQEKRLPTTADERLSDLTIDPSFPAAGKVPEVTFPDLLRHPSQNLQTWIMGGRVDVPDELFRIETLEGFGGSWVALSGFVEQEDSETRRRIFGILQAVMVKRADADALMEAFLIREYPGNLWIPEGPASYYVFAGEMPWSPRARQGLTGAALRNFYGGTVEVAPGQHVSVEVPNHRFSWESYHSVLNGGPHIELPATTFAESFDLRAVPESYDWCDPSGSPASLTVFAPPSFRLGHLLYMREDLIKQYCQEHDYELIWVMWGERQLYYADYTAKPPDWLYAAYAKHDHIWRRVETLSRIAP